MWLGEGGDVLAGQRAGGVREYVVCMTIVRMEPIRTQTLIVLTYLRRLCNAVRSGLGLAFRYDMI
jgi:hypothetical protein